MHSLDHWGRQQWDAAMLHACNAVDGTGRERYPKLGVAARFKRTVRDGLDMFGAMGLPLFDLERTRFPISVKSDLDDKRPDIADLLYGVHRCAHGHGDSIPEGFELTSYVGNLVQVRMAHDGKVQLSAAAVLGLLAVAVFAPENKSQRIPPTYYLSWYQERFPIAEWWGRQDDFREMIRTDKRSVPAINFGHWWNDWKPI